MTYEEHLQIIRDWDEQHRQAISDWDDRHKRLRRMRYLGYALMVLGMAFFAWDIYYFLVIFPGLRGCH